jgi:hypothetical protein
VGTDHEDQAVSKESLGRHRDRRCHIVGGSHGAGCDHQRGAAGDAGIASGEEERHGGVGGGQVPKDWQCRSGFVTLPPEPPQEWPAVVI